MADLPLALIKDSRELDLRRRRRRRRRVCLPSTVGSSSQHKTSSTQASVGDSASPRYIRAASQRYTRSSAEEEYARLVEAWPSWPHTSWDTACLSGSRRPQLKLSKAVRRRGDTVPIRHRSQHPQLLAGRRLRPQLRG